MGLQLNILLVGTLASRLQRLRRGLRSLMGETKTAQSSAQVWQTVMRERIDTIVLDTTASNVGLDPWLLCTEISQATNARVIALTRAGQNQDRVRAFRAGAFTCLTMPVSPSELAACLGSVHRTVHTVVPNPTQRRAAPYLDAVLQIDIANRLVRRGGKVIFFAPREAMLLQCLLKNTGHFVGKEDLGAAVWPGAPAAKVDQRLKIYISMLRQKIEPDPRHPRYIVSRHGEGYGFIPKLDPDDDDDPAEANERLPQQELAAVTAENGNDAADGREE